MPLSVPPQLNATDSLNSHVTSRCCSPIKRYSNAAYRVFVGRFTCKGSWPHCNLFSYCWTVMSGSTDLQFGAMQKELLLNLYVNRRKISGVYRVTKQTVEKQW